MLGSLKKTGCWGSFMNDYKLIINSERQTSPDFHRESLIIRGSNGRTTLRLFFR